MIQHSILVAPVYGDGKIDFEDTSGLLYTHGKPARDGRGLEHMGNVGKSQTGDQ